MYRVKVIDYGSIATMILTIFLFIGCGSNSTKEDSVVTNGQKSEQIQQVSFVIVDKNKRHTSLNYGDIFKIIYNRDNSGLFVYRKINDYTKSLDYFVLEGDIATYSHTLETFYKLDTTLSKVILLNDGLVGVLKLGSMQILTIHDYKNQKKLSSLITGNFGKYLSIENTVIVFENKRVDISDVNEIKFIADERVKSIDEQLSNYYAKYKYYRVIKRVTNGVFVVRSEALKDEWSPPINSYEYLEIINNKIEYKSTILSGHASDTGIINIFELGVNKVAIHRVVDSGGFLVLFDLSTAEISQINIPDEFFHGRHSKEISAGIIRLEDINTNVDLRDPTHLIILKDSEVIDIPDDLHPTQSDLHVYAGDNHYIYLGNSAYLVASSEYGFNDTAPLSYTWVLDDEIISTNRSFTFTPKDEKEYKFILMVKDIDGNTAYDYVYVYIQDNSINISKIDQQLRDYYGDDNFSIYQTLSNGLLVRHKNKGSSSSSLNYFSKKDGVVTYEHMLMPTIHVTYIMPHKIFELDNDKIAVTLNNDGGDGFWIYDLNSGEKIDHHFASKFVTTRLGDGIQISKNVIQLEAINANIDLTDPYNPIITHSGTPRVYLGENQTIKFGESIFVGDRQIDNFIGDKRYQWIDQDGIVVSEYYYYKFIPTSVGEYKFVLKVTDKFGGSASDYILVTVE